MTCVYITLCRHYAGIDEITAITVEAEIVSPITTKMYLLMAYTLLLFPRKLSKMSVVSVVLHRTSFVSHPLILGIICIFKQDQGTQTPSLIITTSDISDYNYLLLSRNTC